MTVKGFCEACGGKKCSGCLFENLAKEELEPPMYGTLLAMCGECLAEAKKPIQGCGDPSCGKNPIWTFI